MKRPLDRRVLIMALGAAAVCIGILLLGRFPARERPKAFQTTAVGPVEFRARESQSTSDVPSVLTETASGTPASAVSGSLKKLIAESPRRPHKVSDSGASGPTEMSPAPVRTEALPRPATNVPRLVPARSNHKDWNHAESVVHDQTAGEAASEEAGPDAQEQALLAALKSAQSTFIAGQEVLRRKLADADESAKDEIRQTLKQSQDTFLAQQNQLREQLRQLRSSKDTLKR